MATTLILKEATRLKIRGTNALATGKKAGYIHAIGSWVGLVAEEIVGTNDDFNTGAVKGIALTDGNGDGLGDLILHGVYAVALASGVAAPSAGDALFADVANNRATDDDSEELLGWVWPQDDASTTRDPTSDDPTWLQGINTTDGEKVVHVRLAGFPKTGLV